MVGQGDCSWVETVGLAGEFNWAGNPELNRTQNLSKHHTNPRKRRAYRPLDAKSTIMISFMDRSLQSEGFSSEFISKMDWQGQKLAEQLMQILLLVFAVVGFFTGYITGSFQMMVLTYAGGVVLTTLVTVPNWPFFNRNPLKWLDPSEAEKHPKPQPQPQQPVSSKKKASKK
ncbi:unnamed protein product [Prunus armeniaca]|uniref:Signal peptidase complex subunit 1 n=1 Tax=Prunus armeniaca TaxID=36596 RepID=A0A6J5TN77_PRUAR|nr:unnamed protein product [Prunus armeniaca]